MFEFTYRPTLIDRGVSDYRLRAAFHEAGHAIIGYHHVHPPLVAKIFRKNDQWEGDTSNTIPGQLFRIEPHLYCAGFYAEAFYTGVYNEVGAAKDKLK